MVERPETPSDVLSLHEILKSDPHRYLDIVDGWLRANPNDAQAHFNRHFGSMALGRPQEALDDMNRAIALDPKQIDLRCRAGIHRHLGQYKRAAEDYARGEVMDPKKWERDAIPLLYQADTHARLGDEVRALECCSRLPDDFWTPGPDGTPPGGKTEIAEELRRRAESARKRLS